MSLGQAATGAVRAPGLARRLACFSYEAVLLFGVVMMAGLLYSILTDQRHALNGSSGLKVTLFVVLCVYFVGFWSGAGQTLAMQTWHIRLVTVAGCRVSRARALCRYLLCWLWVMPALLTLNFSGLKGSLPTLAMMIAGIAGYASLVWFRPDRQYWHDAVCGTRLVTQRPSLSPG